MKNIIREELLSKLLIEGRLQDIIKKYGKEDQENIDDIIFFSERDPSGNNKYLEWLVKNWLTPLGNNPVQSVAPNREELVNAVELFHDNLQRMDNKDINSYKHYAELKVAANEAEEKRKEKEKRKEAKKEKKVIYTDDRWLVVSPQSWKASCFYGAGTKWCVSSKNSSNHWDQYSKRSTFFYVIDKKKTQKDPLYKVAYRILSSGRKEVWDAEDLEISTLRRGEKWLNSLPKEIKEKALEYHESQFGEAKGWLVDNPKAQALAYSLGHDEIYEVEEMTRYLEIFRDEIGQNHYAVGDGDEVDSSFQDYLGDLSDSELLGYYSDLAEEHLTMDDIWHYSQTEAEGLEADLDNEDILLATNNILRYQELEASSESLDRQISDAEDELDELNGDDDSDPDEIGDLEDKLYALEVEQEEVEADIENLIYDAREEYKEDKANEIEYDIEIGGPIEYFIHDRGMFNTVSQLLDSGLVSLERDELIERLVMIYTPEEALKNIYGNDVDVADSDDGIEHYIVILDI